MFLAVWYAWTVQTSMDILTYARETLAGRLLRFPARPGRRDALGDFSNNSAGSSLVYLGFRV